MATDERVLRRRAQRFLIAEFFKQHQHALAGLMRPLQISRPRLVGAAFLLAAVRQDRTLSNLHAARKDRHAGVARTCGNSGHTGDHRRVIGNGGFAHRFGRARPVGTRHMACFMRDDADDFHRGVRLCDEARVVERILSADDEGVDVRVHDQMDGDRRRCQSGGLPDGQRIVTQHAFGFGVAHQCYAVCLGGANGEGEERQHGKCADTGERRTAGAPHQL